MACLDFNQSKAFSPRLVAPQDTGNLIAVDPACGKTGLAVTHAFALVEERERKNPARAIQAASAAARTPAS
jgi:hypothetical protein